MFENNHEILKVCEAKYILRRKRSKEEESEQHGTQTAEMISYYMMMHSHLK